MLKIASIALAAVAAVAFSQPAAAHRAHHHGYHHGAGHHKAHHPEAKPAKVRYGGKPGRGYWRPGPARGRGFGFATYKGDPFGKNDYFDGGRCHYLRGRSFCDANIIFNGFWDRPTQR
ncbi:MAG: hypothetical protein HOP09_18080 [Hyphomicrobium sp.]|nr:hypothetical protein [Hyphomicrobium sp.]